jgi:transcriptional regulator with XRE-family HTH domain
VLDLGTPTQFAEPAAGREDRRRELGGTIRALRRERHLSTIALARACGVSPSLISQVERGLTAPSLDVLWAIARALDVPIGTFFQPGGDDEPTFTANDRPAAVVVRAGQRKQLGLTPSLTYQLLSPDLQHQIEFIWVEFQPGEEGPAELFTHVGEEQMVVIQGEMHFWVGGELYVLHAGDCITIDSAIPHRAGNHSDQPAIVIAAITPPSF